MLTNFQIYLMTCPPLQLALLPQMLYVDLGAMYVGADLFTEGINLFLGLGVTRFFSVMAYVAMMMLQASRISTQKRSRRLGTIDASRDNSKGLLGLDFDPRISKAVLVFLQQSGVTGETFTVAGVPHPVRDPSAAETFHALDGTRRMIILADPNLIGSVIASRDVAKYIFGSLAFDVSRARLPRVAKSSAAQRELVAATKRMMNASSKLGAPYIQHLPANPKHTVLC